MEELDSLRRWAQRGDHPLELVVVFGSVAKGTARPDSDIDVGLLAGGGAPLSAEEYLDTLHHLAQLTPRPVHPMDLANASTLAAFQVARDGLLVWERAPGDWIRWKTRAMLDWYDFQPLFDAMTERMLGCQVRRHGG